MGLYHNVYLVFGAPVTKNEMNPNLSESVEKLAETHQGLSDLEWWPFYNGEHEWLILSSEEVEANEYMGVGDQFIVRSEQRTELLTMAANLLDVEIGWPSWYVLHDYS